MHYSVMPRESLELLAIRPEGIYLDSTTGLGGHTGLIAQRLTTGIVIANDRDAQSLEMARANTAEWADRIRYHHGSFGQLADAVAEAGFQNAGWSAGGPRGFALSAYFGGERFFVPVGWASGHADGPEYGHDSGRSSQLQRREGARRPDFSARRRKESAENSQSNRPSTAHTEHTPSGRCSGAGRAPDG